MPCCHCHCSATHNCHAPYLPSPPDATPSDSPRPCRSSTTDQVRHTPYPSPSPQPQQIADILLNPVSITDNSMIPKPKGEVNRPGRGGYTLDRVLGWRHDVLIEVKQTVKTIVIEGLDCTKPFIQQSSTRLETVRQEILLKYPMLHMYTNLWAVNDLIRTQLALERAKRKRKEAASQSARIREARRDALNAVLAAYD
ncbi:hypothetical protein EV360DRAFT_90494 [Lentinula raphanica]|nr:hypothetical protein EV360DRAFT_90494 [Lentinula raphanica]